MANFGTRKPSIDLYTLFSFIPNLRNYPTQQIAESYQRLHHQAVTQTNLEISTFLTTCPYSLILVLAEHWLAD